MSLWWVSKTFRSQLDVFCKILAIKDFWLTTAFATTTHKISWNWRQAFLSNGLWKEIILKTKWFIEKTSLRYCRKRLIIAHECYSSIPLLNLSLPRAKFTRKLFFCSFIFLIAFSKPLNLLLSYGAKFTPKKAQKTFISFKRKFYRHLMC